MIKTKSKQVNFSHVHVKLARGHRIDQQLTEARCVSADSTTGGIHVHVSPVTCAPDLHRAQYLHMIALMTALHDSHASIAV